MIVISKLKYPLPHYHGYCFHDTPVTMCLARHGVDTVQIFKITAKDQN